ncbi:hypothetical protein D3C86_1867360 [compost metagenome]
MVTAPSWPPACVLPVNLRELALKVDSPASASLMVTAPFTLSLPPDTPRSSVTDFASLVTVGRSFVPLMVMLMVLVAVPSADATV